MKSHVGSNERVVAGLLSIAERHDEHVAALCVGMSLHRSMGDACSPSTGIASSVPRL
jgi:hypothetical protein